MADLLDAHGGGYHPMVASGGSDHGGGWWSGMWIFAIVIIFFALLLIWRRDEGRHPNNDTLAGVAPVLAAGMVAKPHYEGHHEGSYQHWDIVRDELREFGELKKENALLTLGQSREMDRGFYEQRAATDRAAFEAQKAADRNWHDTLLGFKNSEIQGMNNTAQVLARVDALERRQDQETIRKQGEELNYLKTVMALQPHAPIPAYFPNYGVPIQHNVYEVAPPPPAYPRCG